MTPNRLAPDFNQSWSFFAATNLSGGAAPTASEQRNCERVISSAFFFTATITRESIIMNTTTRAFQLMPSHQEAASSLSVLEDKVS